MKGVNHFLEMFGREDKASTKKPHIEYHRIIE